MNKIVEPIINVNEISRIALGVVVKGDISTHSDIRVDGQIEGTIFSDGKVVVGDTAKIAGALLCSNLDVCGKLEGEIYVKDVLTIKGSATIDGNIYVRKFQVDMGAKINGACKMITEQEFTKAVTDLVKNPVVIPPAQGSDKKDKKA